MYKYVLFMHTIQVLSQDNVLSQLSMDCQSEVRAAAVQRLAGLNCSSKALRARDASGLLPFL